MLFESVNFFTLQLEVICETDSLGLDKVWVECGRLRVRV